MARLVLILVFLFVVAALLRVFVFKRQTKPDSQPDGAKQNDEPKAVALVACPDCGVHVPQDTLPQHQLAQHAKKS